MKDRNPFATGCLIILLTLMIMGTAALSRAEASVYKIYDYTFSYGGTTVFHDDFEDGVIPGTPPYVYINGIAGLSESGGALSMDTSLAKFINCEATRTNFSAGVSGYIQATFLDAAPLAKEYAGGLEFGNVDQGGVAFGLINFGDGPVMAMGPEGGMLALDRKPVTGLTGTGTITMRLDIVDLNTTDGLIDFLPSYWLGSGSAQTLAAYQLPIASLDSSGVYTTSFSCTDFSSTAVPLPGAVYLLGSGLIGLIGLRKRFSLRNR